MCVYTCEYVDVNCILVSVCGVCVHTYKCVDV